MTMSSTHSKPPRPCTEYNIFFQLERAYILQVLLRAPPTDDPARAFHPRQPDYAGAGLPPLPSRYASLVLPYDWHLPGKEQRRKRKHRKSHGAISFHDLSRRVVDAWRVVDDDVKVYCARVSAVGMARYKAAMRTWKQGARSRGASDESDRSTSTARAEMDETSIEEPFVANEDEKKVEDLSNRTQTPPVNVHFQSSEQRHPMVLPPIAPPQPPVAAERNQAVEDDIDWGAFVDAGTEENASIWESHQDARQEVPKPTPTPPTCSSSMHVESKGSTGTEHRSESTALPVSSARSIGLVDIEDSEIIAMWKNADGDRQRRHDDAPSPSAVAKSTSKKCRSEFGLRGYAETMQEVHRMVVALNRQKTEIDTLQRGPRRRSIVACSA